MRFPYGNASSMQRPVGLEPRFVSVCICQAQQLMHSSSQQALVYCTAESIFPAYACMICAAAAAVQLVVHTGLCHREQSLSRRHARLHSCASIMASEIEQLLERFAWQIQQIGISMLSLTNDILSICPACATQASASKTA